MDSMSTVAPWARNKATSNTSSSSSDISFQLPIAPSGKLYGGAMKMVKIPQLLSHWKRSEGYAEIMAFILTLNETIKSKPMPNHNENKYSDNNPNPYNLSEPVLKI